LCGVASQQPSDPEHSQQQRGNRETNQQPSPETLSGQGLLEYLVDRLNPSHGKTGIEPIYLAPDCACEQKRIA
jgi:hypothetical protein